MDSPRSLISMSTRGATDEEDEAAALDDDDGEAVVVLLHRFAPWSIPRKTKKKMMAPMSTVVRLVA